MHVDVYLVGEFRAQARQCLAERCLDRAFSTAHGVCGLSGAQLSEDTQRDDLALAFGKGLHRVPRTLMGGPVREVVERGPSRGSRRGFSGRVPMRLDGELVVFRPHAGAAPSMIRTHRAGDLEEPSLEAPGAAEAGALLDDPLPDVLHEVVRLVRTLGPGPHPPQQNRRVFTDQCGGGLFAPGQMLVFTAPGGALAGELRTEQGSADLTGVMLEGDKITFTLARQTQRGSFEATYTGTIAEDGDSMAGTFEIVQAGFTINWTATRAGN